MNIILTGFMGTGKTTIGKRLAKRLGWRFVDVDQWIEECAGLSIPRIFAERGETVFRRLERRCISRVVHCRHHVIATGGGAFVDPQSRARLRVSGPVICLAAKPQVIFARISRNAAMRPLLSGSPNPPARIRTLLAQRAGAYAQADLTVDTSDLSIDEVVEQVWRHLHPYVCQSWQYLADHAQELAQRYGGRYIAAIGDHIVADGDTQLQAFQNARGTHGKPSSRGVMQDLGIYYIPLPEESLTAL